MIAKKFFAIFFLFFLLFLSINGKPYGDISLVITVDDEGDGDFTSIQEAVDHAKDGDIILVYSGVYNESVRIENKSITIEGIAHELGKGNDTGKPVIIANGIAIEIYSDNCNVKNIKVSGGAVKIHGFYNKLINNDMVCSSRDHQLKNNFIVPFSNYSHEGGDGNN